MKTEEEEEEEEEEHDAIHRKVMKTLRRFFEEDGMDFDEAAESQ